MSERSDTTRLLADAAGGAPDAVGRLFPVVYDELRRLARSYLKGRSGDSTLQATALVHEAYLKLVDGTRVGWKDRAHFFALAARAIRQVLIDHERGKGRVKRWGGQEKVSLDAALTLGAEPNPDFRLLDRALEKLEAAHPERARVVELRFFGGLTHEEIAEVLGVTTRTVERYWRFGRAWLYREVTGEAANEGDDAESG
jgi:RNA polymerase sigma factor (TIGR02999 family)